MADAEDERRAAARQRLQHTQALLTKTDRSEQAILDAALQMQGETASKLQSLAPRVHLDQGASDEYEQTVLQRGQLDMVIAKARQSLAKSD